MAYILIGYSGHAFVAADIIESIDGTITAYCDHQEKENNPLSLSYLGAEDGEKALKELVTHDYFVSIGNNNIRAKVSSFLQNQLHKSATTIRHPHTIIGRGVQIGAGSMLCPNVVVNAQASMGMGTILNTASVVEHECSIGAYAHIAPGAVLAGNVTVGDRTFIGAGAVVKQGVTIGSDVTIGAGTVVIRDVPNGVTIVGNPGRILLPK